MLRLCYAFFAAFLCQAAAADFSLTAAPSQFTLQRGSSAQVIVTQTAKGFSGLVSYVVYRPSGDFDTSFTTVANTATVKLSASATASLGVARFIVQGTSSGISHAIILTATVVDAPPAPVMAPTSGNIQISSVVPASSQTFNFTALGTADWFSMGAYGSLCGPGPCMPARKTGGAGFAGVLNSGGGDTWFYPYTPNFANVTWSDSPAVPNNSAAHVNNRVVSFQAFAGTETRTITLIAGVNGGGTFTTTLHMTDGVTADVINTQTFNGSGVRVFTIQYNAASAGHQLAVTLTHSGGELILYGAALAASLKPETHYLTLSDNIQAFIQAVAPGDTLVLPDGYSSIGHLILPARLATGYVDIRSNTTVPAGSRVMPGELKVSLISPDEAAAIQNDSTNPDHSQRAARGWRFTGIEITALPHGSGINYAMISLGFGPNPLITDIPRDITFDRCYIHGDGSSNYIRGVVGNANNITISNSYIGGFVSSSYEANAINIYSSAGPINIVNNYLEASGENIMIGGSGPDIGPILVPTNGLIQHNYFNKPPSWRGGPFIIKNLLEFKDGYGFTIDSNVFENCWLAAQDGYAIVVTPRTAGGTIANHVDTLTFTNNIIAHVGSGILIGLSDDLAVDSSGRTVPPSQLQWVHDVIVRNNLFDDLSLRYSKYSHGMLIFGPPSNLVIDHNTYNFGENTNDHGWYLANDTGVAPSNTVTTNNDFGADLYGDSRGPTAAMFTGGVFTGNNIRNASQKWSSSQYAGGNTFNMTAPANAGADVTGLVSREAAVKSGNR